MKLYFKTGPAPHHQSIIADKDTGETIAVTYSDEDGRKGRLLAAAPELLEALQELLESSIAPYKSGYHRLYDARADARAAIAKATQD